MLSALDPDWLDAITGAWMWLRCRHVSGRVVVSFDGKTIRGAKNSGNRAPHLVAGLLHGADVVIAQTSVDAKTNEIPALRDLLTKMCLTTVLVVADALHTQVETARQILNQHGAYLFTIKANQPTLYDTCRGLPWKHVPATSTSERHRGQRVTRTIKVVAADHWTGFPGAAQIARLTRTRTDKDNTKTTETVYLICSLPSHHASPRQLLDWVRHHWHIENRLHWVRDVVLGEDLSTAHTGHGPHVMASFRNLVIGLLRSHGHTNISAALRHYAWHPTDLTELILTSTNKTMP